MKALVCTRLGGPDDLEIHDLPDPVAGPGEVVVRVEAAALNFFDTLIIAGRYQTKPQLPFSPAAEFAGTVEAVGEGVSAVAPGERVAGYAGYGAARERIAVKADRVVKLPPGLEADRAAGLIVTYGTSYYALKDRAQLIQQPLAQRAIQCAKRLVEHQQARAGCQAARHCHALPLAAR